MLCVVHKVNIVSLFLSEDCTASPYFCTAFISIVFIRVSYDPHHIKRKAQNMLPRSYCKMMKAAASTIFPTLSEMTDKKAEGV